MKQAEDNKTVDAFELPIITHLRQIEQQAKEKADRAPIKRQPTPPAVHPTAANPYTRRT